MYVSNEVVAYTLSAEHVVMFASFFLHLQLCACTWGCCGCVHTQYAWVCVCVFRGIGMLYMCVCVHMCVSFWGCTYVYAYAAHVCV